MKTYAGIGNKSQSPLVGASGPAKVVKGNKEGRKESQSPLVGASGPAKMAAADP